MPRFRHCRKQAACRFTDWLNDGWRARPGYRAWKTGRKPAHLGHQPRRRVADAAQTKVVGSANPVDHEVDRSGSKLAWHDDRGLRFGQTSIAEVFGQL